MYSIVKWDFPCTIVMHNCRKHNVHVPFSRFVLYVITCPFMVNVAKSEPSLTYTKYRVFTITILNVSSLIKTCAVMRNKANACTQSSLG